MKVILLAGGLGSRLAEETVTIPKPMVEVGGRPIIARVMDIYSAFGHHDFIVAAGYKGNLLKQFFASYHLIANDITVSVDTGKMELRPRAPGGWNVSVVDTGPTKKPLHRATSALPPPCRSPRPWGKPALPSWSIPAGPRATCTTWPQASRP
jgi:NDP-sugar pyrophosphorylase family protein